MRKYYVLIDGKRSKPMTRKAAIALAIWKNLPIISKKV